MAATSALQQTGPFATSGALAATTGAGYSPGRSAGESLVSRLDFRPASRVPPSMLRSVLRSIGLATAVVAGAAAAQAAVQEMERAGWTLVTASEDTYVYMRPHAAGENGVRQVWTAYDSEALRERDGFTFRSVRSLGEFDCKKRLSRVLEEFYHDAPGLKGRSWRSPKFVVTPWAAPQPDSIGAVRMAFACKALVDT